MKKCGKCSVELDKSNCHISSKKKHGFQNDCKECKKEYSVTRRRTKLGLVASIYNKQLSSSRRRNHPKPDYSLSDLRAWMLSQPIYHLLFSEWEKADYGTRLVPSCDRMDSLKPYTLLNIKITTWQENCFNNYTDVIMGNGPFGLKPVDMYSLTGKFIDNFHSAAEATRITGIHNKYISKCCLGKQKTAKGYVFKFSNTPDSSPTG